MWVDKITKQANDSLIVINDSKTPSGRVHVGSLRGVLIHDALFRELKAEGKSVVYSYGIDDYDPMDGFTADAGPEITRYMGMPLCNIPAPEGSSASDMADHYIAEFLGVFAELGVGAKIYRMRDVYRNGRFNEVIDTILKNAHIVREVYESVSGAKRPDNWYPFQVVCECCGKVGTTQVTNYANGLVEYHCRPDLVSWAEGCGHKGKISPFDGNGKLPWKLEWAAKWHEFKITLEGAGKDHCTKGGSRDVAALISRRIFNEKPPLNVPYEFFLVGGAKMSSSKGLGASAREMADFLPAEILRYLMVRTDAKRAVNFTTDYNYLVKLYNDFDRILDKLRNGSASQEDKMIFHYSQVSSESIPYIPASFQLLTSLLQLPHVEAKKEIIARLETQEGTLTENDIEHLQARIKSAKYWLDNLASEDDKFEVQAVMPTLPLKSNSASQNAFLKKLAGELVECAWNEESLQTKIFAVSRNTPLPQPKAFEAIYRVLLGKDKGPKAGALLSYLKKEFVLGRLAEINYSPTDFIKEVAVPLEQYGTDLPEQLQTMAEIKITPEIYLCLPNDDALEDKTQFKTGYGIAAVNYIQQGKSRTDKVLVMFFEGYDEIHHQSQSLMSKLVNNVEKLFNKKAEISQFDRQGLFIEVSPKKLTREHFL